jgi:uncharacterized protein
MGFDGPDAAARVVPQDGPVADAPLIRATCKTSDAMRFWRGAVPALRLARLAALKAAPQRLTPLLMRTYRLTLSPVIGADCRHLPTCSHYAEEAFGCHGFWGGGWMTLARLLRCHPFGTSGLDFVPRDTPPGACWYLPWRYGCWRGTDTEPPAAGAPGSCQIMSSTKLNMPPIRDGQSPSCVISASIAVSKGGRSTCTVFQTAASSTLS